MQTTNIADLKMQLKTSEIVELPSFVDGTQLICELRKPSLVKLMAQGKVPNTLMEVAMKMFKDGSSEVLNKAGEAIGNLKDLMGIMELMAKASLVSPTYEEFEEAGIELTETQLMAILIYTQTGVKQVENFRKEQEHLASAKVIPKI